MPWAILADMSMAERAELDERVVRLLAHLVGMATESKTPNRGLIEWAADLLQTFGARVTIIDGPHGRANLLATIGPNEAGGLLLSGHTDVVPAGTGWASDPYTVCVDGDNLVGRGTADMKGFIACVLCAVEDLDRTSLVRPIHIALSYDEEVGCIGVRGLLETVTRTRSNDRVRPDLVVIGEPTMMRPRHAHLGKVAYHIDFTAAAAHSSLSPFLPSAITSAVRIVNALQEIADLYRPSATRDEAGEGNSSVTVNVGSIRGGGALNVLSEHCELTFELRHDSAHDPDELLSTVHAAIAREADALTACGGGVDVVEIARYPALSTDPQNPWVRVVERAADRGASTPLGFGTEGGLFAEAFQTTVMVCGPGDIGVAHRADEYVSVEQLQACMSFVAHLIEDVCVISHPGG